MGNCCGKQSSNNFEGDGRTLGSVPPSQPVNARVTPAQPPKRNAYTPTPAGGRTLGSSVDAGRNDPKSAAARAAEVRHRHTVPTSPCKEKSGRMTMSVWI